MADDSWKQKLICVNGRPRANLANCITALRLAHPWAGQLAFNEFSNQVIYQGRQWDDHDDRIVTDWLNHQDIDVGPKVTAQAVLAVSRDKKINPLLDFLTGIEWDGRPRIDNWLYYYLGAEDNAYTQLVGCRWLISAVARAIQPGCKADCCLILEGAQGIGKSRAIETLASSELYSDAIGGDLSGKEASILCVGTWIVELSELESLNKSEVGAIKAFLSRSVDHFRSPYDRHALRVPRQCVFIGTTNNEHYLRDGTGGRRFWPVHCGEIFMKGLERDRVQIWAEAYRRFSEGEKWWLEADEETLAHSEQCKRFIEDDWQDVISEWITRENKKDVSTTEVVEKCLKIPPGDWDRGTLKRVASCLLHMGWVRYKLQGGPRRFKKPIILPFRKDTWGGLNYNSN